MTYAKRFFLAAVPSLCAASAALVVCGLPSVVWAGSGDAVPGVAATALPFRLEGGHAYVDVKINDKGPFHFIIDTGALNVMTPATASKLGLSVKGRLNAAGTGGSQTVAKTHVAAVTLGSLTKTDQDFYVVELPSTTGEGVEVDGLIGYEWFKSYPIQFDYDANVLTLLTPDGPDVARAGRAVPITFRGRTPQVDGKIDGYSGRFTIDTGSNGSLTLNTPFVAKNDLVAFYHAKTKVMSAVGVGGPVFSLVARGGSLSLGTVDIDRPVIFLSQQQTGVSTDANVAGNIGFGVLHRFNVIFDYPNSRIFFTPNSHWAEPDLADRSGLRLSKSDTTFTVVYVAENSPASESGLKAGDHIISVDGKLASEIALAELQAHLKEKAGTQLTFTREGDNAPIKLVLRDL